MTEDLETRLEPWYEPPEFKEHPEFEDYIEQAKEKYGINLEEGKFYSRKHFEDFCKLIKGRSLREFLLTGGTYITSVVGLFGASFSLVPISGGFLGVLGFFAAGYGASLGAIALCDSLLPVYEGLSGKVFRRGYKKYCEDEGIPYDTL